MKVPASAHARYLQPDLVSLLLLEIAATPNPDGAGQGILTDQARCR